MDNKKVAKALLALAREVSAAEGGSLRPYLDDGNVAGHAVREMVKNLLTLFAQGVSGSRFAGRFKNLGDALDRLEKALKADKNADWSDGLTYIQGVRQHLKPLELVNWTKADASAGQLETALDGLLDWISTADAEQARGE